MTVLLLEAFVAGLITAVTPCILPVLPVIVAGGATGSTGDEPVSMRRPIAIVTGVVLSFGLFTLFASTLLSFLHLPQDFLHDLAIVMLFVLAAGLIIPPIGHLLERPFYRFSGRAGPSGSASGFVLGLSLGLVFAPCAGPVLSTVSAAAAQHRVGIKIALVCFAYTIGTAVSLFALALVAQRTTIWQKIRRHLPRVRQVCGVLLLVGALAITFNFATYLQQHLPGPFTSWENDLNPPALQALNAHPKGQLRHSPIQQTQGVALDNIGQAPPFTDITQWLNTPGDQPLTLQSLRGKVVLVDFWTYSCINCQRSLPHVEAWYREYHKDGLVVVGVHTPEFAFEHVVSNVKAAAARLGVVYPVAVDDNYGTWTAYNNEYWPAEYLIDQRGDVRRYDYGEGGYGNMEQAIRELLQAGGATDLPPPTDVLDRTPTQQNITNETYLGDKYLPNEPYAGTPIVPGVETDYRFPSSLSGGQVSFGGRWTVGQESAAAKAGAEIRLSFTADDVYLVLGGSGTVDVTVDGRHQQTVHVSGVPYLYTMVHGSNEQSGLLQLDVSPGVQAYDFTFG